MSDNSFTEVTSEGWGGRIMSSIKGIAFGGVLFLVAFPLMWWNEGRAVNTSKKINFANDNIVAVSIDKVDPANEAKLVHVSGKAETDEVLKDKTFGVESNALGLIREVEMYQWVEEKESESKKKLGGSKETVTTYKYEKQWSSDLVKSSDFKQATYTDEAGIEQKRSNPTSFACTAQKQTAKDVTLGAFAIPSHLISRINKADVISGVEVPKELQAKIKKTESGLYVGKDTKSPQIGDLKISFKAIKAQDVSILAKQTKETFSAFNTPFGDFEKLEAGVVDSNGMIANAKASNSTLTWILRVVGVVCLFLGFNLLLKPFVVLADVIPFLGSLVGVGTAMVSGLVAILCASLTIGIAWIFYRPLVGIPLVLISVGASYMIFAKRKKRLTA